MDWKIILPVLLSFMLVISVFAGCTQPREEAAEAVKKQVEALPSVEEFQTMDRETQQIVYYATQAAYDAYLELSEKQQEKLSQQKQTMEELFAYFNTLIMPLP